VTALHPEAEERARDFAQRNVLWQPPVHDRGWCPACDAWRILLGEASDSKRASRRGMPSALPEKPSGGAVSREGET
jgi:hypothetical protein